MSPFDLTISYNLFLHPSPFHHNFLQDIAVLVCPNFNNFLSQHDFNCTQNTSSHAHVSQSCRVAHVRAHRNLHTRACVWLKMFTGGVLCLAHSKVIPSHSMFHKTLLGVPDTFSSFCSSPPQMTPTSRPLTGIKSPSLCHFAGRKTVWLSG